MLLWSIYQFETRQTLKLSNIVINIKLTNIVERGKLNAIMKKHEAALVNFDKAHAFKPCCVDILGWRAETKLELHDFGGALQDLNTTHHLDPHTP